tara:strand:- start:448 stop:687 length:240 start_codon:yes stop_codon:yes gene_type:complete
MTEGMKRIISELTGEQKDIVINRLHDENKIAKESKKLRLASDLNNLIFFLNNPGVKPGGVKKEDLDLFKKLQTSLNKNI